jgi:hypothetical protein
VETELLAEIADSLCWGSDDDTSTENGGAAGTLRPAALEPFLDDLYTARPLSEPCG